MRQAGFFLGFGIVIYILIVVFTLPAARVDGYIEAQIPGLSLSAVSGSVFNGQAGQVSYQGKAMGSARWKFLSQALLTGRVEYHLVFSTPAGPGKANAGVTFTGKVYGHDIDLILLPDQVINNYSPVVVRTSGEIKLLIETLEMSDGFPDELDGKAVWKGAAILAPVEMIFGDTEMDMQSIGGELVGRIDNEGGFDVSGEVALAPGGKYRFDLLLSPDTGVSEETVLVLENTTTVQADGKYQLRSSGQW